MIVAVPPLQPNSISVGKDHSRYGHVQYKSGTMSMSGRRRSRLGAHE